MPRLVPLPEQLKRSAFLSSKAPDFGLTPHRLRSKDVAHPFRGVSTVGLDPSSPLDRCLAYQPLLRAGQYFSHSTAAALLRIPLPHHDPETKIHVAVPAPMARRRGLRVVGHELTDPATTVAEIYGLPIIGPADVWCQLAIDLTREDLVAAGDYLISGERTTEGRLAALSTVETLAAATDRYAGKRGAKKMSWALPRLRTRVDSRPESLLRLLLVSAGFPEPLTGHPTLVDGGRGVLRPDLKWKDLRIVFEYEGDSHLSDRKRFRSDITRRERFEAAGWRVIRVTADDLFVDPVAFVARVRRIVSTRSR